MPMEKFIYQIKKEKPCSSSQKIFNLLNILLLGVLHTIKT